MLVKEFFFHKVKQCNLLSFLVYIRFLHIERLCFYSLVSLLVLYFYATVISEFLTSGINTKSYVSTNIINN